MRGPAAALAAALLASPAAADWPFIAKDKAAGLEKVRRALPGVQARSEDALVPHLRAIVREAVPGDPSMPYPSAAGPMSVSVSPFAPGAGERLPVLVRTQEVWKRGGSLTSLRGLLSNRDLLGGAPFGSERHRALVLGALDPQGRLGLGGAHDPSLEKDPLLVEGQLVQHMRPDRRLPTGDPYARAWHTRSLHLFVLSAETVSGMLEEVFESIARQRAHSVLEPDYEEKALFAARLFFAVLKAPTPAWREALPEADASLIRVQYGIHDAFATTLRLASPGSIAPYDWLTRPEQAEEARLRPLRDQLRESADPALRSALEAQLSAMRAASPAASLRGWYHDAPHLVAPTRAALIALELLRDEPAPRAWARRQGKTELAQEILSLARAWPGLDLRRDDPDRARLLPLAAEAAAALLEPPEDSSAGGEGGVGLRREVYQGLTSDDAGERALARAILDRAGWRRIEESEEIADGLFFRAEAALRRDAPADSGDEARAREELARDCLRVLAALEGRHDSPHPGEKLLAAKVQERFAQLERRVRAGIEAESERRVLELKRSLGGN